MIHEDTSLYHFLSPPAVEGSGNFLIQFFYLYVFLFFRNEGWLDIWERSAIDSNFSRVLLKFQK